ncbi:VCBS repeat-containing protein [Flavisolibacter sp. BT320]|nr:VCBS repeat-containing protein [Flavisolibacter longurius]
MKKRTSIRQYSIFLFSFSLAFASCKSDTMFESLSSSQTNIAFVNKLEDKHLFNILYYLYYYNGGGVSAGDVNGDGLSDLYFTANSRGGNKLYINRGNFKFEDVTTKAGVAGTADWCTGSTMADVNGDGLLDIYVSTVSQAHGLKGHNQLFINNGNGSFTESAEQYGLNFSGFSTQAAFFDYDRDGDLDCFLINQSHHPHANVVDTINRRKSDPLSGDRLFRNEFNNGQTKFTDVTAQAGIYQSNLGYGLGLAVADFNNDGWDDVYVGNDFHENDYYYLNNGNGTFTESGAKHFGHYSRFSMGNDAADFNNDGQLDIVTVDMLPPDEKVLKTYGSDENPDIYKVKLAMNGYQDQCSRNCLQTNNGNGSSFRETALIAGISATDWSWCPLFADFDNDGAKDLLITSGIVKRPVDLDYIRFVSDLNMRKGMNKTDAYDQIAIDKMPDGSSHPFFYKGDGKQYFKDVSNEWGTADMKGYFNGASYVDLDNDGNLDVVINQINAPALVLKNIAPKKAFLSIQFKGEGLNSTGIGAKAYVFQKGRMQYQQLMLTRGFASSSDTKLHFGLDSSAVVDSLLVVWPDQRFQVLKNITGNQKLVLDQKASTGQFNYLTFFPPVKEIISAVNQDPASWRHQENDFVDFNKQYLIPHALSTRGPKIAVGDVNGDGLEDMYTCGAKGQAGTLFLQVTDGSFLPTDKEMFLADAGCEDVDAIFFDANGDQKLDLYVVSGGNEAVGNDTALLDRLYLNDGKGKLMKTAAHLPAIFANKSTVAVADVDKDGDTDIFVGTLADAGAYGFPQTSYLLVNDGRGKFSKAAQNKIALEKIGLVTASAFADVNKDGWDDLIVSGEWMPIVIFLNKNGSFQRTDLPASTGWWQTIYCDDVNGDGNIDLLLGNWGWNNKFWSGKNGPVKMYVSDFDKNGRVDQLLSYTVDGKEYPFLAKDEAERSLPVLKKHYLFYNEFAGLEMKDAYYGFTDQVNPYMAERLGSVVCYGDGKGGFSIRDLPSELQLAPVFSFQKLFKKNGETYFISGGNFYDVIPYEGRYDAQPLAMFKVKRDGNILPVHQPNLYTVKGQVRDLKWLRTQGQTATLCVAANNSNLIFYKLNE